MYVNRKILISFTSVELKAEQTFFIGYRHYILCSSKEMLTNHYSINVKQGVAKHIIRF